jgi:hypothetical protein
LGAVDPLVAAAFFTVLPLLHVDEPEPDWLDLESESAGLSAVGLGFDLGVRVVGLGDVVVVGVEGAVGIGVELLDATTLGFLAFLLLIFSSSSEEGYGDIDSRPTWALAYLVCLAADAAFLLCTELALNEGARFRDCSLSKGAPQNESERRIRWTRGSGGCICWSEEEDVLDRVDARWSLVGREKRVLSDDEEPE